PARSGRVVRPRRIDHDAQPDDPPRHRRGPRRRPHRPRAPLRRDPRGGRDEPTRGPDRRAGPGGAEGDRGVGAWLAEATTPKYAHPAWSLQRATRLTRRSAYTARPPETPPV